MRTLIRVLEEIRKIEPLIWMAFVSLAALGVAALSVVIAARG
jgi:hypothetical protein